MPIELGEVEQESQEVKDLKATVKRVADTYTRAHGWCDVVNQALADAGITESGVSMEVTIQANLTINIPCKLDVSKLKGKTEEEINTYLGDNIGTYMSLPAINHTRATQPLVSVSRSDRLGDTVVPAKWSVTDVNEFVPPPPPRSEVDDFMDRIDVDWTTNQLRFTSGDGRVMHIVSNRNAERNRGALCGGSGGYRTYWTRVSGRSEHRVCQHCLRAIGATLQPAGEE